MICISPKIRNGFGSSVVDVTCLTYFISFGRETSATCISVWYVRCHLHIKNRLNMESIIFKLSELCFLLLVDTHHTIDRSTLNEIINRSKDSDFLKTSVKIIFKLGVIRIE